MIDYLVVIRTVGTVGHVYSRIERVIASDTWAAATAALERRQSKYEQIETIQVFIDGT